MTTPDASPAPVADTAPAAAEPDAPVTPPPAADAAVAPDDPDDAALAEPPLAAGPLPTVWTPELVPEPVREDPGARAFLAELARDGLAGHLDPALGLLWEDANGRTQLAHDAVGEVAPALQAALATGSDAARCRAGICLVAADARWFVLVRRTGADRRVVVAVLRSEDWPASARYVSWAAQAREMWQGSAPSLIGSALSFEEGKRYQRAFDAFQRLWLSDPENPWPLYYMARMGVALGRYREAYVDFRRLAEHPAAVAVRAQLRLGTDAEMARFRTHSAVKAVQVELELPAPDEPRAFLAWLQRFRAVPERLATVIAPAGPAPQAVADLVEAHLLDAAEVTPTQVRWSGASLALRNNALGALEITALSEATPAAPGSPPPE